MEKTEAPISENVEGEKAKPPNEVERGVIQKISSAPAVDTIKRTRNHEQEYQELLSKMRWDFYAGFGKHKALNASVGLDNYEKLRVLGTGSFGVVYQVRSKVSDNYYAMKVLDKRKVMKYKQLDHTLNEKNIMQSIRFPFIIGLEHCYKDNAYLYLLMPFVNGGEMFTILRKRKYFEEPLSKFYAAQVVLALEYMHYLDILYRDLKPENILIDSKGFLKLVDLGFCKIVQGRTWTLCGTPEYIAPEIILSKGYGKSADWWSFGILIYEMTAGMPPFNSNDHMKLYEKIIMGKYKFPLSFSIELKDLVKNILQVDLTRRYGNLKNGVQDIKTHRWFRDINWISLFNKKIDPPYKPLVATTGDASNFDYFEEPPLEVSDVELFTEEFKHF